MGTTTPRTLSTRVSTINQVTTTRNLLTRAWAADADVIEDEIRRFALRRSVANPCKVALFEVEGDRALHVNVTHRAETRAAGGWIGPAVLADGFLHNRTFADAPTRTIVRHIREMVVAPRV